MPIKLPTYATIRSYLLLIGGLAVIGWEVVVEQAERPTIIVAALLMMGISVPLRLDEKAKAVMAALTTKDTPPPPPPQPDHVAAAVADASQTGPPHTQDPS